MKKKLNLLLMAVVAVMVCIGFGSCGDDDEEGGDGGTTVSRLEGVWLNDAPEDDYSATVDSDDGEEYTYTYDSSTGIMTLHEANDYDDTWQIRVVSLDDSRLVLEYIDENPEVNTFARVECLWMPAGRARARAPASVWFLWVALPVSLHVGGLFFVLAMRFL